MFVLHFRLFQRNFWITWRNLSILGLFEYFFRASQGLQTPRNVQLQCRRASHLHWERLFTSRCQWHWIRQNSMIVPALLNRDKIVITISRLRLIQQNHVSIHYLLCDTSIKIWTPDTRHQQGYSALWWIGGNRYLWRCRLGESSKPPWDFVKISTMLMARCLSMSRLCKRVLFHFSLLSM